MVSDWFELVRTGGIGRCSNSILLSLSALNLWT